MRSATRSEYETILSCPRSRVQPLEGPVEKQEQHRHRQEQPGDEGDRPARRPDRRPRAGKTAWAALHTVRRHGGRVEGVIALELDVPRRWLRRNRRGLWYTPRDVPLGRIKRVIDLGELAASPAEMPAA